LSECFICLIEKEKDIDDARENIRNKIKNRKTLKKSERVQVSACNRWSITAKELKKPKIVAEKKLNTDKKPENNDVATKNVIKTSAINIFVESILKQTLLEVKKLYPKQNPDNNAKSIIPKRIIKRRDALLFLT
jgi:hypothetical protein